MPKLPIISGMDCVKALEKIGYEQIRQKGSHIRLKNLQNPNKEPITIPNHKGLGKGLLRKILRQAEIGVDDLIGLL